MPKSRKQKEDSDQPKPFPSGYQGDGSQDFEDASRMPLGDHLEELRRRVVLSILGIVPIFVGALIIGDKLVELLLVPMRQSLIDAGLPGTLLATSPTEPFFVYIKVSLVLTLILGAPWVLYQFWRFVAPGLYANERRFAYLLLPMSFVLSVGGVLFLYYVILPVVLAFFIGFGSNLARFTPDTAPLPEGITLQTIPILEKDPTEAPAGAFWINEKFMQFRMNIPEADGKPRYVGVPLDAGAGISQQPKLSEFVKLFLSLAIGFAIGFQTPVVILLLGWADLVTPKMLSGVRKPAALVCAGAGAILTPADPISMVLLAVPLYFLYELGTLLLRLMPAKMFRYDTELEEEDPNAVTPEDNTDDEQPEKPVDDKNAT